MKNEILIFFSGILLISAIITCQNILQLKSMLANAYTVKPANGHSWTEMECSEGLCVTAGNKVGVGTDSPSEKFEVYGDILVTGGDACNGGGYCLSDLDVFY